MDQLREGLSAAPAPAADAGETLRLAEAVRVLALRHGPAAVRHCTQLVEERARPARRDHGAGPA